MNATSIGAYFRLALTLFAILTSPAGWAEDRCNSAGSSLIRHVLKFFGEVDHCLESEEGPLRSKNLFSWNNPAARASVLTPDQVQEIFAEMAGQPDIPFEYPEDGCYARATQMSYLMEKKGIKSVRVYVEGKLWADTSNSPMCRVERRYHVAPMVLMETKEGDLKEMVIDPSLSDHAITREEWIRISTSHFPQAPKTYVRSAYYYGTGALKAGESQVSMLTQDSLDRAHRTMEDYMQVQLQRRERKKNGTFPKCDKLKG